ncbi:hypothetical protein, partial [Microcystis aeruginosa]|uniref:hypothetical protein n=1 Tax=Microcystis aeruginosa TaxID=1126 RepID=UPI001C119987
WWLSFAGSHQVKISNPENVSSLLLIGDNLPKKRLPHHPTLTIEMSCYSQTLAFINHFGKVESNTVLACSNVLP